MNFEQGTPLARRQDRIWKQLKAEIKISKKDIRMLEKNLWVKTAAKLAPGNLVVRHFILIDLINNNKKNMKKILIQLTKLAPDIWAEGYSYWLYTRPFLATYSAKTGSRVIREHICDIEQCFCESAYMRGDEIYPAPFGDVRDEPLDSTTLSFFKTMSAKYHLIFLRKSRLFYYVDPYLLGFNTHTPKKREKIRIVKGVPSGFKFYTGYNNKYKTKRSERKDTFTVKRFFSIFR